MKKLHILLVAIGLVLVSCKPSVVEVKFSEFDLTMTAVKGKKEPVYKKLSLDNRIGEYRFDIGKNTVILEEIESSIYPENVKILAEAITGGDKFVGMLADAKYPNGTLEFPNGAFGVLYSKKGSSGKTVKHYIFYFKKGERYFCIYPLFNNELKGLRDQLSAIESLK